MMAAAHPLLVALGLALGAAPRAALVPPVRGPPQPLGFVTRRGAQLLDGGGPFRFAGPSDTAAAKSDDASASALPRSRSRTAHARLGQRKLRELRARLAATPKPPPPPPPPCPPTLAAEAAEYGRISVKSCGAIGNHSAEQDTAAIELAMNMTKACKVSTIYFPPAHAGYSISRTIVIDTAAGGLVFQGSSGAGGWGVMPPLVIIQAYNHSRPVFLLNVRSPAQKIFRASFTSSSQEIPTVAI